MPIPLVIIFGGVAISAIVAWKLRRKKFRIAVLGARESGKTTLINSWRGEWVDGDPGRTQAPKFYDKTKLTAHGLHLTFTKLADVSGAEKAWPQWESQARESRYLLYLVDARTLAGNDGRPPDAKWFRLENDAGQIGEWIDGGGVGLCLLVVTHTDEDNRLTLLGEAAYHDHVTAQLDPITLKLGGDRKVRVVIGCLADEASAEQTTEQIMQHILTWEKTR